MRTYTFNVTDPAQIIVVTAANFSEARAKLQEQLAK
jgi:hypothetical protein